MAQPRSKAPGTLPRPSTRISDADVPDLLRDPKSGVLVSAGGRDRGPEVKRGPGGGKRHVHLFERVEVDYEDLKHPITVTRVVDTLSALYRKGTINSDQFRAGKRFQDAFDAAHMESAPTMRFDGLPASGRASSDPHRPAMLIDARTEVYAAMSALGGWKGSCGVVAQWAIGMRWSLRQLAEREAVKRVDVWTGVLIGALDILSMHYQEVDRFGKSAA